MNSIEELESLVWRKIQIATQKRDTAKLSMLNSLAAKLESIKSDLETIEQSLINDASPDEGFSSTNTFPPEGTNLRFVYKNKAYTGVVKNQQFFIYDFGFAHTLSRASMMITKNNRNGWRDWYFQLPGDSRWILADDWRGKG